MYVGLGRTTRFSTTQRSPKGPKMHKEEAPVRQRVINPHRRSWWLKTRASLVLLSAAAVDDVPLSSRHRSASFTSTLSLVCLTRSLGTRGGPRRSRKRQIWAPDRIFPVIGHAHVSSSSPNLRFGDEWSGPASPWPLTFAPLPIAARAESFVLAGGKTRTISPASRPPDSGQLLLSEFKVSLLVVLRHGAFQNV